MQIIRINTFITNKNNIYIYKLVNKYINYKKWIKNINIYYKYIIYKNESTLKTDKWIYIFQINVNICYKQMYEYILYTNE